MRRTVYKWFWAWSFDKEEQWLNDMAAKGFALISIGFCKYMFENSIPNEYVVRMELLENLPAHKASQQYIQFLEDTGAEYIGAVTRWVYFRKKTNGKAFDLYSDNASRIQHLNRIMLLLGIVVFMNILAGFNIFSSYHKVDSFGAALSILNLCLAAFISYGLVRLFIKQRKLKKQHNIFE